MSHVLSITLEPPLRNVHVVAVAGELDVATCGELEAFLGRLSGSVVLDCDALAFLDVASTLALERAAARLGRLSLVNIKPQVARVIGLTGRSFLLDRPGSGRRGRD